MAGNGPFWRDRATFILADNVSSFEVDLPLLWLAMVPSDEELPLLWLAMFPSDENSSIWNIMSSLSLPPPPWLLVTQGTNRMFGHINQLYIRCPMIFIEYIIISQF